MDVSIANRKAAGIPLNTDDHDEFLEVSVSDTEIGISGDSMAKLFRAFCQIGSRLSRKFEGGGLGLAMVSRWRSCTAAPWRWQARKAKVPASRYGRQCIIPSRGTLEEDRRALLRHAQMIAGSAGEHLSDGEDRQAVGERFRSLLSSEAAGQSR